MLLHNSLNINCFAATSTKFSEPKLEGEKLSAIFPF